MWRRLFNKERNARPPLHPLFFYNTLGQEKQEFSLPSHASAVRMYNCGPTVYDTSHIGNLRSYVFADLVRRVLEYNGYTVKQVINITDFGHLSSDADSGQDKMSAALKRAGQKLTLENMRALAEKYTEEFIADLQKLNIDTARITFPRASDYIKGEIALIQTLEEKGYTYRGADGVYFDTSRFPEYGKLGNIDIEGLKKGARVAVAEDKRSPTDFLLWKSDKKLGWDSPWGLGFPGWHIECSAMINACLGKQIDIHTGGVDLIPTHHNNEIAQSEAATGKKPFARYWMHNAFLNIKAEKISKSAGNMINLSDVVEKGVHPLAYRYFLLTAHYRSPQDFSWEALQASSTAFDRLQDLVKAVEEETGGTVAEAWRQKFHERINDDLDTPGALALVWEMTKDETLSRADLKATLYDFDRVLGLSLATPPTLYVFAKEEINVADVPEIKTLVEQRDEARKVGDFKKADDLRQTIELKGYVAEDTNKGTVIFKKR